MRQPTSEKTNAAFYWLPVFAVLIVLPLVSRYKLYESRLAEFAWTPFDTTGIDFYLYYKQSFFLFLTGILFFFTCLFLWKRFLQVKSSLNGEAGSLIFPSEQQVQWKTLIPLGIYLLFALISSLFSGHIYAAFTGSDGQFESFFVLAGYVLLVVYLLFLVQTEQDIYRFLICLLIEGIFLGTVGILQYSGNNPVQWEWVQRLMTPRGYLEACGPLESTFESWRVSLFSYNPNYAGMLLAMLSAFCLGMLSTEARWKHILGEGFLLFVLLISLFGTGSKAGLLTFIAVGAVLLLFLRKKIRRYWRILIPVGVLALAGIFVFLHGRGASLWTQVKQALTLEKSEQNPLQGMLTEPDGVYFTYRGISFSVALDYEDGFFGFMVLEQPSQATDNTETEGTSIPLIPSEDRKFYYMDRAGLEDVTIRPGIINDAVPAFSILLNGREWMFVYLEEQDNHYFYLNQYLKLEELEEIRRFGFEGYEHFITERGLIWSMTLPLLKDSLFLGSGANTFAFVYPQNNYKDLYYYTGDATASTRPHSLYLQAAVECGIPALIALLVFFGGYLLQSLRLYWKSDFRTLSERVGLACFLAVAAYLICGLTNDSMITVAPVFWSIAGMGIAVNGMVRRARILSKL